jgi:hypothetical protein
MRLLLEVAHRVALGQPGLTVVLLVDARHDLHERALAGAVAAQQADLRAGVEGQVDVLEEFALPKLLVQVADLENEGRTHRMNGARGREERDGKTVGSRS